MLAVGDLLDSFFLVYNFSVNQFLVRELFEVIHSVCIIEQ